MVRGKKEKKKPLWLAYCKGYDKSIERTIFVVGLWLGLGQK